MAISVLIVEDDRNIQELLQHYIFDECTRKGNCIQFFCFPYFFSA